MRKFLWSLLLVCTAAGSLTPAAQAGPKTRIKECKCSINTPKNWYVLEYQAADGLEYLVTSSPHERPAQDNIPGIQFLRQKLEEGVSGTPEEFLTAVGAELNGAKLTQPVPAKLGKEKAASFEAVWGEAPKTYTQRYYATVRGTEVYVLIITWADPADLGKLEESASSVSF